MSDSWVVRPYRRGDEIAISDLYARCYSRTVPASYWHWKTAGPDAACNVWVAETSRRLIGHYAGIPRRIRINGESRWARVAVDAMVDPEMRRRGVMSALTTRAQQSWTEADVALLLGLPNEQSAPVAASLGWRPLLKLEWLQLAFRPTSQALRRWGLLLGRVGGDRAAADRRSAGATFVLLQVQSEIADLTRLVPDRDWIMHRYRDHPRHGYTVVRAATHGESRGGGHAVVRYAGRLRRRICHVADWLPASAHVDRWEFIDSITLQLRDAGVDAALTLAVPSSPLHDSLVRSGFLPQPESFAVYAQQLAPDLDLHRLLQAARCHLVGGDFDVV